ncbi:hypothetical protein [Streptomyces sp. NPDC047315]|uniref:hypothetical protein n=1 Tax=Streptomyces sp. NPDC047315 TaxID=3155142 RepID=UPI0033F98050
MIPTLRKRCAITVGSLVVLASPLAQANDLGPGAAAPGGPPAAAPAVATAPAPDPTASFAGRLAGEGRPRPGRAPHSAGPDEQQPVESQPAEPWTPDRTGDADASVSQSRPSSPDVAGEEAYGETDGTDGDGAAEPNTDTDAGTETGAGTDANRDADSDPQPELTGNAPTAARQRPAQSVGTTADQQVSPVSLGAGMALMGLGIGFLGLRLRRR